MIPGTIVHRHLLACFFSVGLLFEELLSLLLRRVGLDIKAALALLRVPPFLLGVVPVGDVTVLVAACFKLAISLSHLDNRS